MSDIHHCRRQQLLSEHRLSPNSLQSFGYRHESVWTLRPQTSPHIRDHLSSSRNPGPPRPTVPHELTNEEAPHTQADEQGAFAPLVHRPRWCNWPATVQQQWQLHLASSRPSLNSDLTKTPKTTYEVPNMWKEGCWHVQSRPRLLTSVSTQIDTDSLPYRRTDREIPRHITHVVERPRTALTSAIGCQLNFGPRTVAGRES